MIFFLFMLIDSFVEGRAPISKTRGVGRLNNRLAFYAYETKKLEALRTSNEALRQEQSQTSASKLRTFKQLLEAESGVMIYVAATFQ